MSTSSISSETRSGLQVSNTETLEVLAGGSAVDTIVSAGGSLDVLSGGWASLTSVNDGGVESISGGKAFATVLSSGGSQYVVSGGVASGAAVDSGGAEYISAGGSAVATVLSSGGQQFVGAGGVVSDTTANFFSYEFVSSGGVASDTTVNSGGKAFIGGSAVDTVLNDGGYEYVVSGGTAIGTVVKAGATVFVSSGATASAATIETSGMLVLSSGAITAGDIVFSGGEAVLAIAGSVLPSVPISGLAATDTIDLTTIPGASATLDTTTDVLAISAGGTTYSVQLAGNYAGETALYAPDAVSGTDISLACFAAGTMISTPEGEVPVEQLRVGQLVLTLEGVAAPVRWLAVQSVSLRFADPLRVLPICIRAGALAEGVPRRDLLVSPGHALLVGGLLAHASALVNGTSIARVADMPEVFRYYHVELPTHAVIFAEGTPVESFLDGVESSAFDNAAVRATTDPAWAALPYPRVKAPRQLPHEIRRLLAGRSGREAQDFAA